MISFPNCKINIGLWVTQRRPDGYHTIQTIMMPVPWCDILEILPATGAVTTLTTTGSYIDLPFEQNLCYRAWSLMADEFNIPPVNIHLHKVIPSGAGLGGGSADASFTLRMLNDLFVLNLDASLLRSLAVKLGMDCPFFIENVPALSTGRGEVLTPVMLTLSGFYLVLIKPPVHVSTAAAFTGITPFEREGSIEELTGFPVKQWKNVLTNDFENIVFELYPEIQEIKNKLYRGGAVYASLSGSGSAVYGLFETKPAEMSFGGCEVFTTLLRSNTQQ